MSQNSETVICKCFICIAENPDGKVVSILTFRRHRKKESSWNNSTDIQNIISYSDNLEYDNLEYDLEYNYQFEQNDTMD